MFRNDSLSGMTEMFFLFKNAELSKIENEPFSATAVHRLFEDVRLKEIVVFYLSFLGDFLPQRLHLVGTFAQSTKFIIKKEWRSATAIKFSFFKNILCVLTYLNFLNKNCFFLLQWKDLLKVMKCSLAFSPLLYFAMLYISGHF